MSAGIQAVTHPESLYRLVLYHRMSVVVWSFLCAVFLVWRFGFIMLPIVTLYELTKFYTYGSFFLPESFIVYPSIYLFALWQQSRVIFSRLDAIGSGFAVWWIVVLREPYVPLGIALGFFVWKKLASWRFRNLMLFSAIVPFVLLYLQFPIQDYIKAVVGINKQLVSGEGSFFSMILQTIGYPVWIFLGGISSHFRTLQIGLAALFWVSIVFIVYESKKVWPTLGIFCILSLAAVRPTAPGLQYYEAFHMNIWYGLFIANVMFCIQKVFIFSRNIGYGLGCIFGGILLWSVLSPGSYVWDRIDIQGQFEVEYAKYQVYGDVIRERAKPGDTLFLDIWDDILYPYTQLDSSYIHGVFIPVMSTDSEYVQAREAMFRSSSPTFYYSCSVNAGTPWNLPQEQETDYTRYLLNGNPSCLWIKKK